jgi:glucose-1-phosphate adenylyltransferase
MKNNRETLAMVMAGGKGERLYPLTLERTKPSVPFGGKYRIIDFALSNLINSGIYSIYVLVQYKSQSLIEHIRTTWTKSGVIPYHFVTVVPPQMRREAVKDWYRGTADAIYQNINLIYDFKPRFVAIFGGDHIYRMNIEQMIDFHLAKKSHLTISTIPVKSHEAEHFGILDFDQDKRVKNFIEKPHLAGDKPVHASMGNYIFDADVLVRTLEEVTEKSSLFDFGKDIIPYLVKKHAKVFAYDFSKNRVPGIKQHEEPAYWRDVGTIESYWQANMDLLGEKPRLNLDNLHWPIRASRIDAAPAYVSRSGVENSFISEGARIVGSKIKNSIIGRAVRIEPDCEIEDSIIMDFSVIQKGCKIKKTIIDRFNNIDPNYAIGFDRKKDAKRYHMDGSGIAVVKRASRKMSFSSVE